MTRDIGMIALGIYLILIGLIGVFKISFDNQGLILGILALIAGVVILLSPMISTRR